MSVKLQVCMYNFLYVSGHLRYHDTRYRSVLTVLSYTPPVADGETKGTLTGFYLNHRYFFQKLYIKYVKYTCVRCGGMFYSH